MRDYIDVQAHNARELGISGDQVINVVLGILTGRKAYSDETMSAHCYRSWRDGKPFGRLFLPPIDWLFGLWQKPDPEVNQLAGHVVYGHCERATWKEKLRRGLPPEYR